MSSLKCHSKTKRSERVFHNVIFERTRGGACRLHHSAAYLLEHCGYGALHNEMIRDSSVVGLQGAALAERLQMDPDLTLAKAGCAVWQKESAR